MKKLICWLWGHKWAWVFDDTHFLHYAAGNCLRCGEIGDGCEPTYPEKGWSTGIVRYRTKA